MAKRVAMWTALVLMGCAGTAVAASNAVHVKTPRHARYGRPYSISVRGHAAGRERLYLFVDRYPCMDSPYGEHYARLAPERIWYVRGSFTKVSRHWRTKFRAVFRACVYLQVDGLPANTAGGVLATASRTFRVR